MLKSNIKASFSILKMTAIIVAVALSGAYMFFFNPVDVGWLPICPFFALTGLRCPGCGTMRGIHCLLHLEISEAWKMNPFLIIAFPLIGVLLAVPKLYKNTIVGIFITAAILFWWVLRNI